MENSELAQRIIAAIGQDKAETLVYFLELHQESKNDPDGFDKTYYHQLADELCCEVDEDENPVNSVLPYNIGYLGMDIKVSLR